MSNIRVAILDDHQSIIDGYIFRLGQVPEIEVVMTATTGSEFLQQLVEHPVDVILLDVNVPTAPDNPNPYPILQIIPELQQSYPKLAILVISMYSERTLIKALLAAGVSGYVLKDDREAIQSLGKVVTHIALGGIHFSQRIQKQLLASQQEEPILTARQLEVLSLLAAYPNMTTAAAALRLNVAHSTMRNLLSTAYLRLGVRNRSAAILRARQMGLLATPEPPLQIKDLRGAAGGVDGEEREGS